MNSNEYPRWVVIMDAGEDSDWTEFCVEDHTLIGALKKLEEELECFTGDKWSLEDDPEFANVMMELFMDFHKLHDCITVERNDFSTPESNYTLKAQYFATPEQALGKLREQLNKE